MSNATATKRDKVTLAARLRAFQNKERGAISTALLLVVTVTTLLIVAATWFFFRQTLDYTTAQQAQVRSSINQLAANVLGQMNSDFPDEWLTLGAEPTVGQPTTLQMATEQFGNTPELGATSSLTFFAVNPTTGVVTAEAQGKSENRIGVIAKARIQFVPSGAGVFTGLDDQGRPIWVYSNDGLDALALWELNPNSIEYLTPNGDYTSVAPPLPPTVSITGTATGATSAFSSIYCQYGGTVEYRYRYKFGEGEWTAWSEWAGAQNFTQAMNQGQKISVQAMARCRTTMGVTDPTASGPIAEYTQPILPPAGAPTLTIANTGVASWSAISCGTGTIAQYQHRTRLNEGSWTTWTSWADGVLSQNTKALQGARIEFQVRARCVSDYAQGANTATASAQLDRPITSVPARPTVTLGVTSQTATTTVQTATTVPGLTAEYRYRIRVNGGNTWTYTDWSSTRIDTRNLNQGDRVEAQGQSRYNSPYLKGNPSPESAIETINVPVTTKPPAPSVNISNQWNTWTLGTVVCPAGTTPRYTFTVQVDNVTREAYTNTTVNQTTRNISIPEGQTANIVATANCLGTGSGLYGPTSDVTEVSGTRPVTSIPATPTVSYATNGAGTFVKSGCAAGTTWQARYRVQTNQGGWGGWSNWATANTAASPIGQGERVMYDVQARCASGNLTGPVAAATGAWHVYEITAQPTSGGKVTISGDPAVAEFTNPINCPATTSVRVSSRVGQNDAWNAWGGYASTLNDYTFSVKNGNVAHAQLQARCTSPYSEGPNYVYAAVSLTTPVSATTAAPTVSWAGSYATFSYTNVTCVDGLTPQYSYRTKGGQNGTYSGYSAWSGNNGSVNTTGWDQGNYHYVQMQTRCVNPYSNAQGASVAHTESRSVARPIQAGPVPQINYTTPLDANWWANTACPAGTYIQWQSFNRVNWQGSQNKEPGDYDSGWSGWGGSTTRGTNAEEGRSQQTYVQSRCVNSQTSITGPATQGQTGFWVRAVSAGGKWAQRAGFRWFNHGINCYNGAWGSDPNFWITMNRATGWAWFGRTWDYNNQGGNWGGVDYNSAATCQGPYANSGYQWAAGSWG